MKAHPMSPLLKILLKAIHNRIYRKCESNICNDRLGFRAKGKVEKVLLGNFANALMKMLWLKKIHLSILHWSRKAINIVNLAKLIQIIQNIGLDDKDIRLIKNLYWHQSVQIKLTISSQKVHWYIGKSDKDVYCDHAYSTYTQRLYSERPLKILKMK